ncbi:MAG: DUF1211 domain-containing protein [Brevundimonas sp.]|uniref:TMEM175 family protein n=1 Tax=Brevundimonas sp. TaxID=1871086 RepID=UPI0025C359CF|nr:TMEM175 family protein [Brevundimonas sp.]MBX3477459.1 DUF1211 domain-containing protein [Brevundimonas sp.]
MTSTPAAPFRPVETERLDAFVDASFAFAVTLLIIAGAEPLDDFSDLLRALGRIPAFAAGFALVVMFWLGHRGYGRLAPVRDGWSALLSLAIVFMVLIYVFPLRLLTEAGMAYFTGGRLPGRELIGSLDQLRGVYTIYGIGFAALSWLYFLLYRHMLKRGELLGLAEDDRDEAEENRTVWGVITISGLVSAGLAWALPLGQVPWAPGFSYWLIPVGLFFANLMERRRRGRGLLARRVAAGADPAA